MNKLLKVQLHIQATVGWGCQFSGKSCGNNTGFAVTSAVSQGVLGI